MNDLVLCSVAKTVGCISVFFFLASGASDVLHEKILNNNVSADSITFSNRVYSVCIVQ